MNRIAPALYELGIDERLTIRIDSEGGAYLAFGTVNNFNLPFDETTPQVDIMPAVLAGPHSVNRIHLHLVYPQDAPPASYHVTVTDDNGNPVESIDSTLQPDRQRPYRVDVDLVARVE